MAQTSEIESLAKRRRALVAQSAEYRRRLTAEWENLRPGALLVSTGYSIARSVWSAWPLLAPAAGFLASRKGTSWFRRLGKVWSFWRLGKQLTGLWRAYSNSNASRAPVPGAEQRP